MQDTATPNEPEHWRPVVGHEGYYEVSDLGRVRSLPRVSESGAAGPRVFPGRILKATPDPISGYVRYAMSCWPHGLTRARGHVVVAAAFLGPRPPGHDIRHIDGDRTNNRAANLAYGTRAENVHDTVTHGRHPWLRENRYPVPS